MVDDYTPVKRVTMLAALVYSAQAKARDDAAEMFCRRVATLTSLELWIDNYAGRAPKVRLSERNRQLDT